MSDENKKISGNGVNVHAHQLRFDPLNVTTENQTESLSLIEKLQKSIRTLIAGGFVTQEKFNQAWELFQ